MNQMTSPSIWKATGVAPIWSLGRICHWRMTPSWRRAMMSAEDSRNQTVPSEVTWIFTPLTWALFWVG